ncbi:MAG: hypothetical protein IPK07_33550 [Deltaproteobacteria bacterium]|nr:hypothetical protein [Deltaproteobacteria bacterium]
MERHVRRMVDQGGAPTQRVHEVVRHDGHRPVEDVDLLVEPPPVVGGEDPPEIEPTGDEAVPE